MRLKVWSKTLLNVYDCLFSLTNEIDKIVEKFALNSCNFYGFSNTIENMQKIIDITDRKVTLINVKVLIEKMLVSLDDVSCKILTLRFVDKMSHETVIRALNMKRRTYFRKYNDAICSFASNLLSNGFDENKIIKLIKNERWILFLFNEYYEKEISKKAEPEISNSNIFSLAIHNFALNRECGAV
ncbi:MAG: DUF1492 domain-containing protein [Christensenellales bacterium]